MGLYAGAIGLRNSHGAILTFTDVRKIEGEVPLRFGADAVEIAGASDLLNRLEEAHARWAIVTSGTRPLVEGWLKKLHLAEPKRLVTAEDVENGKPDPACYKLGMQRLGVDGNCLVLEDAPAGIRAAKAAGCQVVALATTHATEHLRDAGADWIVQDLRSVSLRKVDEESGDISIKIDNTLR